MGSKHDQEVSVDEFLKASESRSGWLATVEAVDGDDSVVRVSPVMKGGGCACSAAMRVPKSAIAGLRRTAETHTCCGRVHDLVEVRFKSDATISYRDLFEQAIEDHAAKASQLQSHAATAIPMQGMMAGAGGFGGGFGSGSTASMLGQANPGGLPTDWGDMCECIGGRMICCGWRGFGKPLCVDIGIFCGPLNAANLHRLG